MAKQQTEQQAPAQASDPVKERQDYRQQLRHKAARLAWDPEALRAFLLELIDGIAQADHID